MSIQWPLIILAYLALICLGLLDNVRGPYFPQILEDLHLSDTKGAWFFATVSLVSFMTSFSLRRVIKRFGSWNILRFAIIVLGLAFFVLGRAPDFFGVILACALLGVGFGAVGLSQNLAVKEGSTDHMRRRLLAGLHSMYGLASLIGPIFAAWVMDFNWSWRQAFQYLAFVPILIGLVSWMIPWKPRASMAETAKDVDIKGHRVQIIYLSLIAALYIVSEVAISSRMPLYAVRELGLTAQAGSTMLAWFFVGLLSGRLVFLFFSLNHWRDDWILQGSALSSAVCLSLGLWWQPQFLLLSGLCMAPFYPVSLEYIFREMRELSGPTLAYAVSIGSLCVVGMHYFTGMLTDLIGLRMTLSLIPILLLVVSLMISFHDRLFLPKVASEQ